MVRSYCRLLAVHYCRFDGHLTWALQAVAGLGPAGRGALMDFGGGVAQQESVQILQQRLAYGQELVQLVDKIHAAKSVDSIFIELQGEILGLLDAERMTIYALDPAKK